MQGMEIDQVNAWFREHFTRFDESMQFDSLGEGRATLRHFARSGMLRPEGTVAGPVMMMIADAAAYAAILSADKDATGAVTSNLNISFLKAPPPEDLLGEAELLSLGTRLIVCEVRIHSITEEKPVAHATVTYARR
ncbi:MAG: PaaI family thioesterase [Gammaproteobacteria bacterium]